VGVANEHTVDADINLKSLKESTAEVTLNYFDTLRGRSHFFVSFC